MTTDVEEVGIFAPILGLQHPTAPIVLAPGLAIDRMDEAELEEARSWAIADQMMRLEYAIRFRMPLALEAGQDELESSTRRYEIGESGAEYIAAAIWALRLFKRGTFSVPFLISGPPFRPDAHNSRLWEQPQNGMVVYDLYDQEADGYIDLFRKVLTVATKKTSLPAALHRFSQAMARQDFEDRLVDLAIAAESLLVPDRGGETAYRMALRFAFAWDGAGHSRRELFDMMSTAYKVRSWIVHVQTQGAPKLLGQKWSIPAFITFLGQFSELMRLALGHAVRAAAEDDWPPDWEAAILGT